MSKVNLYDFLPCCQANGPGERAVIWVQGCSRRCPGCFNPEAQTFSAVAVAAVDELFSRITAVAGIRGTTFSGGEPFSQAGALAELAKRLQERKLDVVCFTGYTLKQLQRANRSDWNGLLEQVDLLIDGPFVQELRCFEPLRGSSNQKLHFLSGRILPAEVLGNAQKTEVILGLDGNISQSGFPDAFQGVWKEAEALLP